MMANNWLKTSITIFVFICLTPLIAVGQRNDSTKLADLGISPSFIVDHVSDIKVTKKGKNWITLREDFQADPRSIFSQFRSDFKLGPNDRVELTRTQTDEIGMTHSRHQQYYKDVLVEGAEMIVHSGGGRSTRISGRIVNDLGIDVVPKISDETALELALGYVAAEIYSWDSRESEADLREARQDSDATYYPDPMLVIIPVRLAEVSGSAAYQLAYKLNVYSLVPDGGQSVYVDATSGTILKSVSLIPSGTGTTLYNGNQTFTTEPIGTYYRLKDTSRGNGFQTYLYIDSTHKSTITDFDDDWDDPDDQPGISAHWAAQKNYDYFYTKHNRDSFDDNGSGFSILSSYYWGNPNDYNSSNAQWYPPTNTIRLGKGDGSMTDHWVSLNDVGHELGHAMNTFTANLAYEYESGALDESFADIYGTMVEFYVEGMGGDWEHGEDIFLDDSGPHRDLSNPQSKGQPDTYGANDSLWFDHTTCSSPADDFCGVHTNSGVQNYWFYLLADGESGTNENEESYNVVGIGRDDAAAIAYRNHTRYLSSDSDYEDSRMGSIWAASDLFGPEEITQVINAWYAVGVNTGWATSLTLQWESLAIKGVYIARDTITAGPALTINSGDTIVFLAGDAIILQTGFTAEAGSNFLASTFGGGGGSPFGKAIASTRTDQEIVEQPSDGTDSNLPAVYALHHAYPNPFNPITTIRYELPEPANVRLVVYDLLGREVIRLVNMDMSAGYHRALWNGRDGAGRPVPSGLYIARIVTPNYTKAIKMVLLK